MNKKIRICTLLSLASCSLAAGLIAIPFARNINVLRSKASDDDYSITINAEDLIAHLGTGTGEYTAKTDQLHNDVVFQFANASAEDGKFVLGSGGFLANKATSQIRSIQNIVINGGGQIYDYWFGWDQDDGVISYYDEDYYSWASGTDLDLSTFNPNYFKMAYRATPVAISQIVIEFKNECVVGQNPFLVVNGIKYQKANDHAIVVGFASSSFDNVVIEDTVAGLPVTEIGERAFYYNSTIKSINLGANVRKVGSYAFTCTTNLTSITGLNALTDIGDHAFYMCYVTGDVSFSSSLTTIGNGAFMDSKLSTVTFADTGNPYVDSAAFRSMDNLTSIHIGSEMTQFYDDLTYGDALETITVGAGNTKYSAVENVLFNDQNHAVIQIAANRAETSFTLPAGYNLSTYCAYGNNTLEELHLNASENRIPDYSFNYCTSLRTIDFGSNPNLEIYNSFHGCSALESLTITSNVKSIYQRAFQDCTSLKWVEFEEGCTHLNREVFLDCTSLSHVLLPTTLTHIGESGGWSSAPTDVFNGCTALTHVLTRLEMGVSYTGTIEDGWYGSRTLLHHSDSSDPSAWHVMNGAPTAYATRTLYIQSNATYSDAGAWYAVWAWNTKYDGYFFYDHNAPVNYLYCIELPANYRCVTILRMQSGVDASDYTTNFPEGKVWNQSPSFLMQGTQDEATITGWGLDVSWGTHA